LICSLLYCSKPYVTKVLPAAVLSEVAWTISNVLKDLGPVASEIYNKNSEQVIYSNQLYFVVSQNFWTLREVRSNL
jgi:hypothetical protein